MVMILKSQMKGMQAKNPIARNVHHSQVVQNMLDNLGTMELTSKCEMHHSEMGDTYVR
jgi:hypothetical protein